MRMTSGPGPHKACDAAVRNRRAKPTQPAGLALKSSLCFKTRGVRATPCLSEIVSCSEVQDEV